MAKLLAGGLLIILGIVGLMVTFVISVGHDGTSSTFEKIAWLAVSVGLIAIGAKAIQKRRQ